MRETVGSWLRRAASQLQNCSENPTSEAQWILADALQKPRAWLLAHPEAVLEDLPVERLESLLARSLAGEPLPYVLGHWEFYGMDFEVNPRVLIPRPETELMVERALEWLRMHPQQRSAADIGTGSGCIAAALAQHTPGLQVLAVDISAQVLEVARRNVARLGLSAQVTVMESNLLEVLPGAVDVVCANLPYIPSADVLQLPVSRFEPCLALDGGQDGLRLIEKLLEQIGTTQKCRSLALLEIQFDQGPAVQHIAAQYLPSAKIKIIQDLAGKDRILEVVMDDGC